MSADYCSYPRCRRESVSIQIIGKKKFGYCEHHLEIEMRRQDRESEKRYKKYLEAVDADPIEIHCRKLGYSGGGYRVWPIYYAVDANRKEVK